MRNAQTRFTIIWRLFVGAAFLLASLFLAFVWWRFHPSGTTPVVGPAGSSNRAYIENRSFGDLSFVLCVSDWPHTLLEPISVESVMYSEGSDARVFWSGDGSIIAVRKPDSYLAAYDYNTHELIRYDSARIDARIQSRGGLGQEQNGYPDGKDSY
jgi:hypothetical protein